ncbi:zinc finger protein 628-like isoform X2 [Portunus trituberculatus]|nr:zinc finger protein 628-like isoform X2 [Portunus trituberculatus]
MAKAVGGRKDGVTQPPAPFATLASMGDGLQLSPAAVSVMVEGRVEPYELVELFYGSGSGTPTSPPSHVPQVSPQHSTGTSSPEVMQVIHPRIDMERAVLGPYTCGVCGRAFREASHYTKHKRGALCRKLAQRMAKKNKKKKAGKQDWPDRVRQTTPRKPYECTVCGAKFCDRGNVELHLERRHHTRQKLWVMAVQGGGCCPECERWFPNRSELEHHQRQHHPSYLRPVQPITTAATVTTTTAPGVVYYPDPLQQVTSYPAQAPPPGPHLAPQPPPPPPPPPPQPPATAHMHASMATTLLHPPQLGPPPSLIPVSSSPTLPPPAPAHPPMATLPAPEVGEAATKASRSSRAVRPGSAKWNMCGDCGHRFVDPINLELHLQRRHPASRLLDTITIAGNTMLYRTDHTRPDLNAVAMTSRNSLPSNQTYECLLCGFRATVHSLVTNHLQSVHGTANSNLIHVTETPEPTRKAVRGSQARQSTKDHKERHVCEACGEVFPVRVELIRHRVKEKKYRCGVCCLASCSQEQVSAHMAAQHPGTPANTTGLACWLCGTLVYSAATLDEHLKSHGVLRTECVECRECRAGLSDLLSHLRTHLPLQPSRVRLSLSQTGQPTTTQEVEVALDGSVYSTSTQDAASGGEAPTAWAAVAYACSECGACLAGAAQLEAHLQIHQTSQAPHPATSNHSNTTTTTTVAAAIAATTQATSCLAGAGVSRVPGSLEFRCEECGFWRQDGEPVMKHIQAVHMSGNMLHSVRLPSGLLQVHPIQVVTPISTLASQ